METKGTIPERPGQSRSLHFLFVFTLLLASLAVSTRAEYSDMIPARQPGEIRLLSYNIQWGMGADGVADLDRIVAQLERIDADIVILNEVDVHWRRSDNMDQPDYIQTRANYAYAYYGPALSTWASGNWRISRYGNLLLSRFPIASAVTVKLPGGIGREPRSAIVAQLDVDGQPWIVVGTHLGLHGDDRKKQTERILQEASERVQAIRGSHTGAGAPDLDIPVVIMGDFNARPDAPELAGLRGTEEITSSRPGELAEPLIRMFDAFDVVGDGSGYTFPYPDPYARIDYVFVSDDLVEKIVRAEELPVPGSDHLPVIVDMAKPVTLPVSTAKDRIWAGWRSVPCRKTAE